MLAARMPVMTIPANRGGKKLRLIIVKMFSELLVVFSAAGYKALPIRPMETAANRTRKHHVTAIAIDGRIMAVFLIAMNRSSTWGMPK
jgi:hypothetical protein